MDSLEELLAENVVSEQRTVYSSISGTVNDVDSRSLRTVRVQRSQRKFLGMMLTVLVAAAVVTAWLGGRSRRQKHSLRAIMPSGLQVKEATWEPKFDSKCGEMKVDYQYTGDTEWGTNFDHVPTPEMCCAMCQGEPRCKAFVWVKDAGLEGCPSQCWLRSDVGTLEANTGSVAGKPPERRGMPAVPAGAKGVGGSLWCFSLMLPHGTEHKLIKWQHEHSAAIFACDGWKVYSNKRITVAPGVVTAVVDSDLKCEFGGDSGTALNAWIFIAVWNKVVSDKDYQGHDWVVKTDPDSVFFPDRLAKVLLEHKGDAYISNCRYGLHGPIEVFSSSAIDTLAADYAKSWDGKAPKTCVTDMHFGQWGEDMFIDQCLAKELDVKPHPVDTRLICEAHCDCPAWYWCQNGTDRVTFHPFKTVGAYENCMANALGGEIGAAPAPLPDMPSIDADTAVQLQQKTDTDSGDDELATDDSSEEEPEPAAIAMSLGGDAPSSAPATDTCDNYGCGGDYKPDHPCQCNIDCFKHHDCCDDFEDQCPVLLGRHADLTTLDEEDDDDDDASADKEDEETSDDGEEGGGASNKDCRDASKDDPKTKKCFKSIMWALQHGIYEHPDWYPHLGEGSQPQEFQHHLFKKGQGGCKYAPCKALPKKTSKSPSSSPSPPPSKYPPGPRAQTFYMYRAQSQATYPLENINTADLAGVMWYLHNEVIPETPRKYHIDRIKRYKVTVKNTWEFWNTHKRQFGAFVAYDAARCSTPVCQKIYHQYGFIVGCQTCDLSVANYVAKSQTNWACKKGEDQCNAPLWFSLPGPCPQMGISNGEIDPNKATGLDVNSAKTAECLQRMPGGHCDKATGAADCTYSYEEAGEIFLDDLVGIKDYNDFWNASFTRCANAAARGERPKEECRHQKEYDVETDEGVGTSFWNGMHDKDKCTARMEAARALFKQKFPDFPESLEEPPCEFDMYYDGEWDWKINHTNAVHTDWWDNRMPVEAHH